ncbi:MAG: hypothetical protein RMM17_06605 [Acidobacteriota bacterium]|nr:hypothetical protein [Blastocatellia bacterium]MDW8412334.1 hypothetical protein [Acidobacteriota bacterium]
MKRLKLTLFALLVITVFSVDWTVGHPAFLKKAKSMGLAAKNCTFCHESPKGGKKWNERGLWLKEQKKQRGAKRVDVEWLRDYPTDKAALEK